MTLCKQRVKSTMYPKDPILDAQKLTKSITGNVQPTTYTAEYISETNRFFKERVSDHIYQATSAIRKHHISTKHSKAELK